MKSLDSLADIQKLRRQPHAHKGDAGKVLLVGGASSMAGALVLSGLSAMYSGAGWTQLMMLDESSAQLISTHPELMVHRAQHWQPVQALAHIQPDVLAIGPGLGVSTTAKQWLEAALQWAGPLVLDADALNLLATHSDLMQSLRNRHHPTCITPHPGEAARLLNTNSSQIQADRTSAVKALAQLTQCVVVLKGQHSLVASPEHEIQMCTAGNPGMAVGGMGDVLTGCIAAICAQGLHCELNLWQATCLAVQVHALAGDQLLTKNAGPIGMTPSELATEIRSVINAQL